MSHCFASWRKVDTSAGKALRRVEACPGISEAVFEASKGVFGPGYEIVADKTTHPPSLPTILLLTTVAVPNFSPPEKTLTCVPGLYREVSSLSKSASVRSLDGSGGFSDGTVLNCCC